MTKAFVFLIFLLPFSGLAQISLSGRVFDHNNMQTIANASVFLNNATIGDATNAEGKYTLRNVPPGKYELIVSKVGYLPYSQTVIVVNTEAKLPDIILYQNNTALNEVKIKPNDDAQWQRNLELFKNEFIGTSEFAKDCKIVNPELLDLDYNESTRLLSAKSIDYLIIENKALGYRIKYLLSSFTLNSFDQFAKQFFYEGSVFFEEMKGSSGEMDEWNNRRKEVYANSTTHFFRAAAQGNLSTEGFSVYRFLANPERPADSVINANIALYTALKDDHKYRDSLALWVKKLKLPKILPKQTPVLITEDEFINTTKRKGVFTLGCSGDALYVVYIRPHQYNANSLTHLYDQNNISSTLLNFNNPLVYFDAGGQIINAGSLTYKGVWANRRLAELLPVDYKPPMEEQPTDSTAVNNVKTALTRYMQNRNIEKAYLQLDKPYYAAGDTIYFKAYVTNLLFEPSNLSENLKVELINSDNKISESLKLKLKDGMAPGDFVLADTLKNGNYHIRAYTDNMIGQAPEKFYDHSIYIVNEPIKTTKPERNSNLISSKNLKLTSAKTNIPNAILSVQFFPEGGNLLAGVPTKIAFKALNSSGLGVNIKGTVLDDQGNKISSFASTHLGMGAFLLNAEKGKTYKVEVVYADSTRNFDLPRATNAGYALAVEQSGLHYLHVKVTSARDNEQSLVNLVAQSGGHVYFTIIGKLQKNTFLATIPYNKLPEGVTQLTLFSATGEPMNERLVFNHNPDLLNIKMDIGNANSHTRQIQKIGIKVRDKNFEAIGGNFSVAVIDETKVPFDEENESTIVSNLLLTSDINGYVEQPNYYFTANTDQIRADLDVLMLTQGYHGFEWKAIFNTDTKKELAENDVTGIVSGKITNLTGKPVANVKVQLLSVNNGFFLLDTISDKNGHFVFRSLPQKDSLRYVIQASGKQDRKNTLIELDKQFRPEITNTLKLIDTTEKFKEALKNYLSYSKSFHAQQLKEGFGKNNTVLNEVIIKEKRDQKYLKYSSNLNGPGKANSVITADELAQGCLILTDCIAGKLHGIQFFNGTPYFGHLVGHEESAVFIDGIEVISPTMVAGKSLGGETKADRMNGLSINDIESIEVLTDASLCAIYGSEGGGGVILITMKRFGDDIPYSGSKKLNYANYMPQGYYKARTFYSPQYELQKISAANTDLRTTIYWNPNLVTDAEGNTSISFYNADTKGTYRVILEGIDKNGHIGHQILRYQVN